MNKMFKTYPRHGEHIPRAGSSRRQLPTKVYRHGLVERKQKQINRCSSNKRFAKNDDPTGFGFAKSPITNFEYINSADSCLFCNTQHMIKHIIENVSVAPV